MDEFEATGIPDGWQIEIGDLTLLAQSPHLDRSSIRAAIKAQKNGTILWTQIINLTSAKSRAGFMEALAERGTTP